MIACDLERSFTLYDLDQAIDAQWHGGRLRIVQLQKSCID